MAEENVDKTEENKPSFGQKLVGFLGNLGNSASSLLNAGSGVVASGLNAFFTKRENERNRKWTEKQNDLAWNRQRQLINEQRAYDTPKAQMQRLMEAGLNPNLIYGGVDQSPMAAQTAPSAAGKYAGVAPQIDPYVASEISKNMAEVRRMSAQTENENRLTAAQVNKLAKDLEVSDAEIRHIASQINLSAQQAQNLAYIDQMNGYQVDLLKYEVQKRQKTWEKEVEADLARFKITKEEARYARQYFLERVHLTKSVAELNESNKQYRDTEYDLLTRTIDYLVDTAKFERDTAEAVSGLQGFTKEMGTKKGIFWVNTILNWMQGTASAVDNVAETVATFGKKVPKKP